LPRNENKKIKKQNVGYKSLYEKKSDKIWLRYLLIFPFFLAPFPLAAPAFIGASKTLNRFPVILETKTRETEKLRPYTSLAWLPGSLPKSIIFLSILPVNVKSKNQNFYILTAENLPGKNIPDQRHRITRSQIIILSKFFRSISEYRAQRRALHPNCVRFFPAAFAR